LKHTSWERASWFGVDWLRACVHVDNYSWACVRVDIDNWVCAHWLGIDRLRVCARFDIDIWDLANLFGIDRLRACVPVDIDSWWVVSRLIQVWKQFYEYVIYYGTTIELFLCLNIMKYPPIRTFWIFCSICLSIDCEIISFVIYIFCNLYLLYFISFVTHIICNYMFCYYIFCNYIFCNSSYVTEALYCYCKIE